MVIYADQFNEHKDRKLALKLVTSLKTLSPISINFQYCDGEPADYDHKTFSRQTSHHEVIIHDKMARSKAQITYVRKLALGL